MKICFTKMQGAGNDFVVLDETRSLLHLRPEQYRFLADRHFGVGADQILSVRAAPSAEFDFEYVIHNSDGGEVEHCGNGARCFVRYVRAKGLTDKRSVRVKTKNRALVLIEGEDGRVTVDMGAPSFEWTNIPFAAEHAQAFLESRSSWEKWRIAGLNSASVATNLIASDFLRQHAWTVLSMGNPHAVCVVEDVDAAPVHDVGAALQLHPAFPQRVNVGFMQMVSRCAIRLRVYERGVGETLSCGTGACAAVVSGIRLGLLDARVDVHTHGGLLTIEWFMAQHGLQAPVMLTGPAVAVFEGSIDIPD